MFVETALFAFVILFFFVATNIRKPSNLPPGEYGIPLIGYMPARGEKERDMVERLHAKHGKIFCVKMGVRLIVYISDYSVIKTAFGKREFSDRSDFFTMRILHYFKNEGIVLADGHLWSTNRRFAIKTFRDFGMGKSKMEESIEPEVKSLVEYWNTKVNLPTKIDYSLNVAVLNITWGIISGKRLDLHHSEMQKFSRLIEKILENIVGPSQILNLHPWLIPILPTFAKKWLKINEMERTRDTFTEYFVEQIEEHSKNLDPLNPRDYIDMYLLEKVEPEPANYSNLIAVILDLFMAGMETTSSSIRWFIYLMIKNSDAQKKIQNEIDANVPKDRFPSLADKENLPYLEASIYESMRFATLLPFGLPHRTSEDCIIDGFNIPKGALICSCIDICHHSAEYWKKPKEFYPEHFLNGNGKFCIPKEGFLPFSVGRRSCLGEALAKMSLFYFIGALLQQFTFCAPEKENFENEESKRQSFTNAPPEFKVLLKKRSL